ncbi:MAG: hypothetical protein IT381_18640 [Deltaproteobacteria bacterium]|nr:hypothetical protein [Deltaproteobacteria bacterium]
MATRAQKKKAKSTSAPSSTRLGRVEIMLEDLGGKMDLLAETFGARFDATDRKIDALRSELIARIEVLEAVVRELAAAVRKNSEDIRKNSEDIAALRAEMSALKIEVSTLATRAELKVLDERVTRLEAQLAVP